MKSDPDFAPIFGNSVVLRLRDRRLLYEFYVKRFRADVLQWADVWPKDPSFEEVRLRFDEQEASDKEFRLWIHTIQGRLIGEVSLTDIDRHKRRGELSIVLFDPAYWGQGYGTEAARLFLEYSVKHLDLELLYLFTATENKRARRSFEKLGFKVVKRLTMDNQHFVRMEAEGKVFLSG